MKKTIYDRPRPARLGKPKPFNTKTKAYKTARRSAGQKFGKKNSFVKNLYIAKKLKRK
jgi:hypothetical protein